MTRDNDISVLNSLITTTIDSVDGFERAAGDASSGQYGQIFREFAVERRQCVTSLQETVRALGGTPYEDGSLIANAHRRWLDLRDSLSAGDRAIVEEVERGEDHIKSKYEDALEASDLSAAAASAIRKAYESVRAGHDRASQLKHNLQAIND